MRLWSYRKEEEDREDHWLHKESHRISPGVKSTAMETSCALHGAAMAGILEMAPLGEWHIHTMACGPSSLNVAGAPSCVQLVAPASIHHTLLCLADPMVSIYECSRYDLSYILKHYQGHLD